MKTCDMPSPLRSFSGSHQCIEDRQAFQQKSLHCWTQNRVFSVVDFDRSLATAVMARQSYSCCTYIKMVTLWVNMAISVNYHIANSCLIQAYDLADALRRVFLQRNWFVSRLCKSVACLLLLLLSQHDFYLTTCNILCTFLLPLTATQCSCGSVLNILFVFLLTSRKLS